MSRISAPARRAAASAAARLRQGLGSRHVVEIEATCIEDGRTVLIYALTEGRTFTTVAELADLGGTDPEDFAVCVLEKFREGPRRSF